jgi:hypothetical protein
MDNIDYVLSLRRQNKKMKEALELISYPSNWPKVDKRGNIEVEAGGTKFVSFQLFNWMQSIATSALSEK